jgi:hypothetical protein
MGASNALAAFIKYAGKVPPQSLNVLVYMALVSKDSDDRPWFGQGHAAIAQHALGRPNPSTSADLRAVERAVSPLLGDALIVERRAAIRIDGPNTVRYRLNLTGTADARHKPSGVKATEDPPRPTESDPHARHFPASRPTVCGTHARHKPSDRGDTRNHEELKEEENDDLGTELTVARASPPNGNGFCLVCYAAGQTVLAVDEISGSTCKIHTNVVPFRRPA